MGACLPTSTDETPYYAFLTELAENGSLYDCLYNLARIPVKFSFSKKMQIVSEIVSGMSYLHNLEIPVFHLDLKTANILLDANYSVRIADFGLSKLFGPGHLLNSGVNSFIGGTPFYMAPEILDGKFDITTGAKADVYAFGILVNEILDEKIPYIGTGILNDKSKFDDLKAKVLKGEEGGKHRPVLANGPSVLKDLIKNCWKADLKERPTFKHLQQTKPWDEAKKSSAAASDKNIQTLLELFNNNKSVKFGAFSKKCSEVLSEHVRLFLNDENEGPFEGIYIRTLIVALELTSGRDAVTEDSVRRLLSWVAKSKKNEILDLLYSFFNKDFFFGFLTDEQVRDKFINAKSGSYLVRWSNVKGSFVLDYIPKKKKKDGKPKEKAETVIESLPLHSVTSIQELETALAKHLNDLGINDKENVLKNRPAVLQALKIKEKYITSDYSGYHQEKGGGVNPSGLARVDLSGVGATVSHYEFIL